MRPMPVVVRDIVAQHVFGLAAADYQKPIEALAADAADEALGVGVRPWRSDRRAQDLEPFRTEDLIEAVGELKARLASIAATQPG
jgi:hypothetical protein